MFFDFFRSANVNFSLKWKLEPKKFLNSNPLNYGGKVILPEYVLEDLLDSGTPAPFTFEISHSKKLYLSHCGVLEFTGKDNEILLPEWLYQQLNMDECDQVTIRYKRLLNGKKIELIPHSVDFLDIDNPKKELENCLVNYQVLTQGDMILCNFKTGLMRFTINKIIPNFDAIYIVDTDLIVEFAPPIGYDEKIEREKSVKRYVETVQEDKCKIIKMKERGVCFNLDFLPDEE